MSWIIYFLGAFGLAYIMGHAKISQSLRELLGGRGPRPAFTHPITKEQFEEIPALEPLIPVVGPFICDLLECVACSGFWIGVASSFRVTAPPELVTSPIAWAVSLGCVTCAANYIVAGVTYRGNHV